MISRLLNFVRQAAASSEGATGRQGFLSYHAETHALGLMLAVGFTAAATGRFRLVGAALALVLGVGHGPSKLPLSGKLLADIRQEKHYALAALALGAGLGLVVSRASSVTAILAALR